MSEPLPGWHPDTYCYVGGARWVRVQDGAMQRGGQDPANYVGEHGVLPNFRDGTRCRFSICERCGTYDPLIEVRGRGPWRTATWLCVGCCPHAVLARL